MGWKWLLVAAGLLLCQMAAGQDAKRHTLSGFVRDATSGETLPGAHVVIEGTATGAATNNYGHYALQLPGTMVSVHFSYVGYQPEVLTITLLRDSTLDVELSPLLEIEAVRVEGTAGHVSSRSARMGSVMVPKRAITEVPMLLGERDALRVIQLLPGVQKGREGTSGLYVRGGGPDQNLIILDDAPVYNAHHLLGMFSLFNGNAIKSMELQKGGFPARYGGRLASVLDIVMEDGHMREYHGVAGIGLVASHGMVQGPIVKDKASFLVTGRRTYLDLLVRPFLKGDTEKFSAYFFDLTAKLNWRINERHRVYMSGYFGRDNFGIRIKAGAGAWSGGGLWWGNGTGTLRWNWVVTPELFSNVSLIYSAYRFNISNEMQWGSDTFKGLYYSRIQNGGLKWDLNWSPLAGHSFRFGAQSIWYWFTPQAMVVHSSHESERRRTLQTLQSVESALYAEDEMRLWDWGRANLGVRLSHYATHERQWLRVEPRVSGSVYITDNLSAKVAFCMMNQHLHLLTGNGLGMPSDLWVPASKRLPPQQSWQVNAGLTYDIPAWQSTVTLEGYYKQNRGVIHYKEGASYLYTDDFMNPQANYWEDRITRGKSWSSGVEVLLQRHVGRLSGWLGYTLSWTQMQFDEINGGRPFWATYDRRHDVSIVLMYHFDEHWRASGTWVYGTGNAMTLPLASYEGLGGPGASRHETSTVTQYGEMNGFRMKPYHRLDLGVQWVKQRKYYERIWSLDVYNAYNRRNPFFYYIEDEEVYKGENVPAEHRTKLMQIRLFPIVPTISLLITF